MPPKTAAHIAANPNTPAAGASLIAPAIVTFAPHVVTDLETFRDEHTAKVVARKLCNEPPVAFKPPPGLNLADHMTRGIWHELTFPDNPTCLPRFLNHHLDKVENELRGGISVLALELDPWFKPSKAALGLIKAIEAHAEPVIRFFERITPQGCDLRSPYERALADYRRGVETIAAKYKPHLGASPKRRKKLRADQIAALEQLSAALEGALAPWLDSGRSLCAYLN